MRSRPSARRCSLRERSGLASSKQETGSNTWPAEDSASSFSSPCWLGGGMGLGFVVNYQYSITASYVRLSQCCTVGTRTLSVNSTTLPALVHIETVHSLRTYDLVTTDDQ